MHKTLQNGRPAGGRAGGLVDWSARKPAQARRCAWVCCVKLRKIAASSATRGPRAGGLGQRAPVVLGQIPRFRPDPQ